MRQKEASMNAYSEREADRYVDPNETKSEKFRRLWDYYRLPVLFILAIALILGYLFFTLITKEKNDMYVLYVTESPANYKLVDDGSGNVVVEGDKTAVSKWESLFADYASDADGNGKTVVAVENLYVGAENDLSDAVRDNKEKIITLVRTAESMLFLCDERGITYLSSIGALEDLSGMVDHTVFDGKAVAVSDQTAKDLALGDTKLYFALRSFSGTAAEQSEEKQVAFSHAKQVLFALCQ